MAKNDRESAGSQDLIDDALRLVDALQRKLIVAGVRKGAGFATAPPSKGDVWEQAVKDVPPHTANCELCPICRLIGMVRSTGPDVTVHLGAAGTALRSALTDALAAYERSRERASDEQAEHTS